jgi:hypothetical protein
MWFSKAYSRHCAVTLQVAQILRARSTPTPSLGKNVLGGYARHAPWAIHDSVVSSFMVLSPCAKLVSARFAR